MNLTERHIINKVHPMWKICDDHCFKSKNLYNYANYIQRSKFINEENIIRYNDLTKQLKHSEVFKDIGSNSGQHTLKMLDKNWKSFFVTIKDWSKNPSKYLGKPKLPKYKDKNGRYIFSMTNMQTQIKNNYLYFAFKPFKPYNGIIKTNIKGKHMQTRIIPKGNCYVLEIIYEVKDSKEKGFNNKIMGIDLGVNNFVTMTNNIGIKPIVINGKGIKSINNYYNKQLAKYRGLAKTNNNLDWTNRLDKINIKRYNKMEYFMHCVSKSVIEYSKALEITTIVIGLNKTWKQECKMQKETQKFVYISYDNFINKLKYKCDLEGINLITTEENYTSGTSFIDNELPIKENYNKSRRKYRGLFVSDNGIKINADVNGSYQIIKKVFPNAFANGIKGVDFHPIVINV
ncbi:RNA-guided endonuclease InsQ/TnpB family protein [Terrisporobacter sp.]|uniref:RNA-guided endonuclease InsQ/TnpB family protein n=1 Tax=Terrisporobacter sp. TaxID=1965305 RepID=UPI0028973C14|nr:transposase [Terrisporobacter sp.]